mgnify:FL=1
MSTSAAIQGFTLNLLEELRARVNRTKEEVNEKADLVKQKEQEIAELKCEEAAQKM